MNVFVVGPEHSGSKWAARLCIAAGAGAERSATYLGAQPIAGRDGRPLCLHRSMPQGGDWPNIVELVHCHHIERIAIMTRHWFPMVRSQAHPESQRGVHHPNDPAAALEEAERYARQAYIRIFGAMGDLGAKVPWIVCTYRELLEEPAARTAFLEFMGLGVPDSIPQPFNANAKWYHDPEARPEQGNPG